MRNFTFLVKKCTVGKHVGFAFFIIVLLLGSAYVGTSNENKSILEDNSINSVVINDFNGNGTDAYQEVSTVGNKKLTETIIIK